MTGLTITSLPEERTTFEVIGNTHRSASKSSRTTMKDSQKFSLRFRKLVAETGAMVLLSINLKIYVALKI
jgi:hypothetical protein